MKKRAAVKDRRKCVCFSVDVELSVISDSNKSRSRPDPNVSRRRISELLDLLESLGVPATFALCGHLFLESCQGHPNHPKPFLFPDDPHTDQLSNPGWYARDLVEEIASGGHEIACHSFSHISFRDPRCDRDVAGFEIDESVRLAEGLGLDLETFVFPRHEEAYHELLSASGFSAYVSEQAQNMALGRGAELPRIDHGMLRVPRHVYLSRCGLADQVKVAIRALISSRSGFYHLWTHDWNLVDAGMLGAIRRLLVLCECLGYEFFTVSDLVGEWK